MSDYCSSIRSSRREKRRRTYISRRNRRSRSTSTSRSRSPTSHRRSHRRHKYFSRARSRSRSRSKSRSRPCSRSRSSASPCESCRKYKRRRSPSISKSSSRSRHYSNPSSSSTSSAHSSHTQKQRNKRCSSSQKNSSCNESSLKSKTNASTTCTKYIYNTKLLLQYNTPIKNTNDINKDEIFETTMNNLDEELRDIINSKVSDNPLYLLNKYDSLNAFHLELFRKLSISPKETGFERITQLGHFLWFEATTTIHQKIKANTSDEWQQFLESNRSMLTQWQAQYKHDSMRLRRESKTLSTLEMTLMNAIQNTEANNVKKASMFPSVSTKSSEFPSTCGHLCMSTCGDFKKLKAKTKDEWLQFVATQDSDMLSKWRSALLKQSFEKGHRNTLFINAIFDYTLPDDNLYPVRTGIMNDTENMDIDINVERKKVIHWRYYDVIYWINRVRHGMLCSVKYTHLRKHIVMGKVRGYQLCHINDVTLNMIGIYDMEEIDLILDLISQLIENDDYNNLAANILLTDNVPQLFCDPVSFELMDDPVLIKASGHIYERTSVESYWCKNCKDPLAQTREDIQIPQIVSQHSLRNKIQIWKQNNCIKTLHHRI